jgi:uncharacterized damage-inducible protein DinB
MSLKDALLPEFDHEMATTRRVLERVPTDKLSWQPHAKSMTLGRLATHIAELPHWTGVTLSTDELDFSKREYKPFTAGSTEEILALFDKNVADARSAIANASEEVWGKTWTLRNGDHVIFTQPKPGVLRSFVLSHSIHHRGQLSVYLRLNDAPVPSIYGPSADEGIM